MRFLMALLLTFQPATGPGVVAFQTGNSLKITLEADGQSVEAALPRAQALGYLTGVSDLLTEQGLVCLTPQVNTRQLADVVLRYLNEHPEKRHFSAASLAAEAFIATFPCPKQ